MKRPTALGATLGCGREAPRPPGLVPRRRRPPGL